MVKIDSQKIKLKTFLAIQNFRFELANRMFNNVRALLLILIIAKQFDIKIKWYLPIVIGYGVFTWFIGYVLDKSKIYKYIEGSYLDRSKTIDVLNSIDKKINR